METFLEFTFVTSLATIAGWLSGKILHKELTKEGGALNKKIQEQEQEDEV